MLQIISGKFFGDGERHEFEGKGILYSNMSWISVPAGRLRVTDVENCHDIGYPLLRCRTAP
jgi:hypothetical protein